MCNHFILLFHLKTLDHEIQFNNCQKRFLQKLSHQGSGNHIDFQLYYSKHKDYNAYSNILQYIAICFSRIAIQQDVDLTRSSGDTLSAPRYNDPRSPIHFPNLTCQSVSHLQFYLQPRYLKSCGRLPTSVNLSHTVLSDSLHITLETAGVYTQCTLQDVHPYHYRVGQCSLSCY